MAETNAPSAVHNERTPLLAREAPDSETQGVRAWFARNAVPFFVSLLLIAGMAIIGVYIGMYYTNRVAATSMCTTPACIHAASEILYNLSPDYKNLDPCNNFEELSCGGWSQRHDLRDDQASAFTGSLMAEQSAMMLKHILEGSYPHESKHSAFSPAQLTSYLSSADQQNFEKLKTAYDACMDESKIKTAGLNPLMEILEEVAAMFPALETWFESKDSESLADTISYLTKLGVTTLVSIGAGADDTDPDRVVISISSPPSIGLPAKDYYNDAKVVKKYEETLSQIIHDIPLSNDSKQLAREVVEFEKQLAAASPDAEDRSDVTQYYNPMSLKEASALVPQIRLPMILKGLVPSNVQLNRLIVMAPAYMRNLSDIIDQTPKKVLQTHLLWKVIQEYSSVVEADEIKAYHRFTNELQGKDPDVRVERWRTCVQYVDNPYDPDGGLGWILSRFFVEKAFSAKAKEFGDRIVSDIKETFIERLKEIDWMDSSVVDLAIEKVHKIVQKIGYPTKSPDIMNPEKLLNYYRPMTISSNFFKNTVSMNRFTVAKEFSAMGKPVDRAGWAMTVPTVNAYYNPPGNEIVFPAGIMQFPVFDVDVPEYLSYGAFGSVSGHELSHAFDSTGRHYDQNGNYTDWWTNSTVAGFQKRADCFIDQYHNFSVPGPDGKPLHVNGRLTLGENLADAGGLSASYTSWKKREAKTPNQNLPGLDFFSHDQLFFINYANWWCGKSRDESAINGIYTDPHAPKFARIIGTVSNSKAFRESFHCPVKEPVCELW